MLKSKCIIFAIILLSLISTVSAHAAMQDIVRVQEVLSFQECLSKIPNGYKSLDDNGFRQTYMFGKAGIPLLSNALDTEKDPYTRAACCEVLGMIPFTESFYVLEKHFSDSEPLVRMQSIVSASKINDLLTLQDSKQLYANSDVYTKFAAALILANKGDETAKNFVIDTISSKDPDIALIACRYFKISKEEYAVDALIKAAEDINNLKFITVYFDKINQSLTNPLLFNIIHDEESYKIVSEKIIYYLFSAMVPRYEYNYNLVLTNLSSDNEWKRLAAIKTLREWKRMPKNKPEWYIKYRLTQPTNEQLEIMKSNDSKLDSLLMKMLNDPNKEIKQQAINFLIRGNYLLIDSQIDKIVRSETDSNSLNRIFYSYANNENLNADIIVKMQELSIIIEDPMLRNNVGHIILYAIGKLPNDELKKLKDGSDNQILQKLNQRLKFLSDEALLMPKLSNFHVNYKNPSWLLPPAERKKALLVSLKSNLELRWSAEYIASRMGAPEFISYVKASPNEKPYYNIMFASEVKPVYIEDIYEKFISTKLHDFDKHAWKLAQLGNEGFTRIKETLSNSTDTELSIKAITALGYCFGNPQAREIIHGYLNNDDLRIAQTAASTLRINLEESDRQFLLAAKQNNPMLNIEELIKRLDKLDMKLPKGRNLDLTEDAFNKYYELQYIWFQSKQKIINFINTYNEDQIVSYVSNALNSKEKNKSYDIMFTTLVLINSQSSKQALEKYAYSPESNNSVWFFLAYIGNKGAYIKLIELAKSFKLYTSNIIRLSDVLSKFDKTEVLPSLRYLIKYPIEKERKEILASLALLGSENDIKTVIAWMDMEDGPSREFIASALQKRNSKAVKDYFSRSLKLADRYVISGASDYYFKQYKPNQIEVFTYTLKVNPDILSDKYINSGVPDLVKLGKEAQTRYGRIW